MRIGEAVVLLTSSVLIGWVGYAVKGPIVPIIIVVSYLIGWVLNYYLDSNK